jgi:hypothetical protein
MGGMPGARSATTPLSLHLPLQVFAVILTLSEVEAARIPMNPTHHNRWALFTRTLCRLHSLVIYQRSE